MAIVKQYKVHSVVRQSFPVEAVYNGRNVPGTIPGMVVELLSSDGMHAHTMKFVPGTDELLGECVATFVTDATINVTFEKA